MDNQIGKRLREFRERTKTKMPQVAAITGILKETLYKWEKGTKPSDLNDYLLLKSYLDKMEDKLEDDQLVNDYKKPATMRLPLNPNRSSMPQIEGKIAAGTVTVFEDEPELIVDRINAPFLGFVEGVIEVTGESMEPTFKSGCRVAITRLKNKRTLHWGECYYLIDINWEGIVKRVYPDEDDSRLKLLSDNPDQAKYPPILMPWHEIQAIFKIKAGIQKY